MMPGVGLVAWLVAGLASGAAYFTSIWWSARQFSNGGRVPTTIALALLRLALLGGLMAFASLHGAGTLLAMTLGVMLARFGVMRRLRGAMP